MCPVLHKTVGFGLHRTQDLSIFGQFYVGLFPWSAQEEEAPDSSKAFEFWAGALCQGPAARWGGLPAGGMVENNSSQRAAGMPQPTDLASVSPVPGEESPASP